MTVIPHTSVVAGRDYLCKWWTLRR